MFDLKPITAESIPRAIEKAERYRLLNEPAEAESICLDILRLDPENQRALVVLLLALTDQFERFAVSIQQAQEILPRLRDAYERAYYAGIIYERQAKAHLQHGGLRSGPMAYGWLREAMECYENAERIRPAGNDDAILRWNACARVLTSRPDLDRGAEDAGELPLE